MEVPKSVSPNYVFAVSLGLMYVWMQRHKRWSLMFKAMDGTLKIRPVQ